MTALPPRHGTASAITSAARLGLQPVERDFLDAFLAITSAHLGEPSTARFVGPTRDAERWSVQLCGREVDVLYHPQRATISAVLRPMRPGDAVEAPADQPRGPGPRGEEVAITAATGDWP